MSGHASDRTRANAEQLAAALSTAARHGVDVWHARAAQDACVLVVHTEADGARLAAALGAADPCRFGWRRIDPDGRTSVIVELDGRPEVHASSRGATAAAGDLPPTAHPLTS